MKKICQNCGKEIDGDLLFCEYCGAKQEDVELICPICKEPFKIGQKKCKKCQTPLPKTYRKLPDEYKKFNWGAFLDPLLWSLVHKDYRLFILLCIPIINIIAIIFILFIQLYYGFKGNEIGWQKFESNDIKLYDKIQYDWAKAHGIFFAILIVLPIILLPIMLLTISPQISENDRVAKSIITNYNAQNFEYICSGSNNCINQMIPLYNQVGEISKLKLQSSSFETTKNDEAGDAKRIVCYRALCSNSNSKCKVCIETRDYRGKTYLKDFHVNIINKR